MFWVTDYDKSSSACQKVHSNKANNNVTKVNANLSFDISVINQKNTVCERGSGSSAPAQPMLRKAM